MRKLRRADDLAAEGKTRGEITSELGKSAATLCNCWRAYGGRTPMRLTNAGARWAERAGCRGW